jgi:hypothetical protein
VFHSYTKSITLNPLKEFSQKNWMSSIALAKIILPLFEAKAAITSSFLVSRFSSAWLVCPLRSDSFADLNFKLFPSSIKQFVPTRGTVEDISSLFGSLQEMKVPQVQSDIDFEVVNSYTTYLSHINNIISTERDIP